MKEIHTEIEIAAPPETVWRELTAFATYSEWNPFIRRIEGQPAAGTRLTVRIEPPGGTAMTFQPTVLVATAPVELRWKGGLVIPGLFDGEHSFRLDALGPNRTKFVHREVFTGLLVPLFGKGLSKTKLGFEAMNQALKARAENSER